MTVEYQLAFIFPAAFALLPPRLNSPEARALLVAIALQESGFVDRRQVLESGAPGPARSFFQFELAGIAGVLAHPSSRPLALHVLDALCYGPEPIASSIAIEHNDVLAIAFARLLLYTLPGKLPGPKDAREGWHQYVDAWRPGKPHKATWGPHYARAWTLVLGD